jgi:hypothetical protein
MLLNGKESDIWYFYRPSVIIRIRIKYAPYHRRSMHHRVAVTDLLNKQSWTTDKGRFSSSGSVSFQILLQYKFWHVNKSYTKPRRLEERC